MRPAKGRGGSVWLRGGKLKSQITITDIDELAFLKKEAKKI